MQSTVLLLFLCTLLAQSQPAPDPSTLARVEGRVINSATGEPLRKAEVQLRGGAGGEYTATLTGYSTSMVLLSPGSKET